MYSLLLLGTALFFALGWMAALWDERLELNTEIGVYRYARGFWPFRQTRTGAMEEFTRLVWRAYERTNGYGEIERRYVLRLESPWRSPVLSAGWEDPAAQETAIHLSARLRLPLDQQVVFRPVKDANRVLARAAIGAAWTGMIAVAVVMLWPVLSGSKPLRLPRWTQTPPFGGRTEATFERGWSAYRRGEFQTAESLFRDAIRENPRSAEAHNMLAYALAEQGKLDPALEAAHKALDLAPDAGYIMDTVAEMYERRQEWKTAVRYYERALRHPDAWDMTETHAKYGRTLLALGRRQEAINQLQRAARTPFGPWGRMARQMLNDLQTPERPSVD